MPISVAEDLSQVRYELELFLLAGEFELFEDKRLVASIGAGRAAADVSYGKLILSCWSDEWSRSWRVVGCTVKGESLLLQCTKQMGLTRCVLELRRGPSEQAAVLSRAEYASRLASMIEWNLPDFRVEHSVIARDDRRHLSGVHVRMILKHHGKIVAGIGAGERELQQNVDAALSAGILWLEELRRKHQSVERLLIFAPSGRTATIATRLTVVRGAVASLYQVDEAAGRIEPVAAFDQGDLEDAMKRASKRAMWPRDHTLGREVYTQVDSVVQLAPDMIDTARRGGWVVASIRGLEFARVSIRSQRVEFGSPEKQQRLNDKNRAQLGELIHSIIESRNGDSNQRGDLLFRAQSERWLESMIRRNVTSLDATLDPRYVYQQVPAYRGEQRSFIDLLGATRQGRLAIIELKVTEDSEFPFQALDYWLRVEWHRKRGDFQRRGYFTGLDIADRAPLLYLVAPLFRFHASTKLIAGAISNRVPVYRIGLNEDWRNGVKVLLRERIN
jgi:hypothetical protein